MKKNQTDPEVISTSYDFPASAGACIDQLYALRTRRLQLTAQADKLGEHEHALREHLLQTFEKTALEGARGRKASASISRKTVARVLDWDLFTEHIRKTKSFDLLQRRVSDVAYNERLHAGKRVPGVEPFVVIGLNLNKVSTKK